MNLPTSFDGYVRPNGRPGVRNRLAILSLCGLNGPGARKIAAALPGSVLISSPYGRGQLGADREFHDRMFTAFGTHPNTGAVLVLAADQAMRLNIQRKIEAAGRPVAGFSLQECEEDSEALMSAAIARGRALQSQLARTPRSQCATRDLILAVECGHSDASSGIVANPLAGDLADTLIGEGGSAVIAETMEWLGTEESLYERCTSDQTAAQLRMLIDARHQIARAAGQNIRIGNPGPQNHEGGITTLEEKSLGAICKSGTSPIVAALAEGEEIQNAGLHLMDTPTLSPESISSMVAGGAQVVVFTTGHGNPYGSALAPTLKITANPNTARRLPRQIDFDASTAFTGTKSRKMLLPDLADLLLETCNGRQTAAERLDECGEVISRLGPSI